MGELVEGVVLAEFNPYHDERGRFTTKSGAVGALGAMPEPASLADDERGYAVFRSMAPGLPPRARAEALKKAVAADIAEDLRDVEDDLVAWDGIVKREDQVFSERLIPSTPSFYDYPVMYWSEMTPAERRQALREHGDAIRQELAANLVREWAATSGDHSRVAVTFQERAAKLFGIEQPRKGFTVEPVSDPHFTKIVDRVLTGMYERTQAALKAQGITELVLHRGLTFYTDVAKSGFPVGRDVVERLPTTHQALSSWSINTLTAVDFAGRAGSYSGTVLSAKVPASRVLSIPSTGFGCFGEGEVVVLGGTFDVRATGDIAAANTSGLLSTKTIGESVGRQPNGSAPNSGSVVLAEFNPYHDERGRFTTKGGAVAPMGTVAGEVSSGRSGTSDDTEFVYDPKGWTAAERARRFMATQGGPRRSVADIRADVISRTRGFAKDVLAEPELTKLYAEHAAAYNAWVKARTEGDWQADMAAMSKVQNLVYQMRSIVERRLDERLNVPIDELAQSVIGADPEMARELRRFQADLRRSLRRELDRVSSEIISRANLHPVDARNMGDALKRRADVVARQLDVLVRKATPVGEMRFENLPVSELRSLIQSHLRYALNREPKAAEVRAALEVVQRMHQHAVGATQVVGSALGLGSSWSGRLVPDILRGNAVGAAEWDGSIHAHGPWLFRASEGEVYGVTPRGFLRVTLHEAVHHLSDGGRTRVRSSEYVERPGWEEGVVEVVTSRFLSRVARAMKRSEDTTGMTYRAYIDALEGLRRQTGLGIDNFYGALIRLPIPLREAAVRHWIREAHQEPDERLFEVLRKPTDSTFDDRAPNADLLAKAISSAPETPSL